MIHTTRIEKLGEPGPVMLVDVCGDAAVSAIFLCLGRGAAAETEDELGAAHLLEHMLFKGGGDALASPAVARVEALGGDLNAYTSFEQTVLHATAPAGCETELIGILAQMAFHPTLSAVDLVREKQVVIEEIRGALDDSADVLGDAIRARAFAGHPYARPILGHQSAVRALDIAALRNFHRRHYRPGNAVLVVAGPVDPDEICVAARHTLVDGMVGLRLPIPAPVRSAGTVRPGAFVLRGFEDRLVELAWPVPGLKHPDMAALDLLAVVLGEGANSILQCALRDEEELAIDTWAALETEPDCGLWVAGALARQGQIAACAQGISQVISELARHGVPAARLRRAQRTVLSSRLYDRETVEGRAHRLAWYQSFFGDIAADDLYQARIRAVRAEDLARVAQVWLRPDRLVVGAVAPRTELTQTSLALAVRPVPPEVRVAARPRLGPASRLVRRTLSCGATVVIEPEPHAEIAAVSVLGIGGMLAEGARSGGLSCAWSQVLSRGAGELNAAEFSAAVEDRSGSIVAWRARNSLGVDARFPGTELDLGLELLGRVLLSPHFAADEVRRAVADLDQARRTLWHDDPAGLATQLAMGALYPAHPWGRSTLGTPGTTKRLGPTGLRRYHRRCIVGRNLVLALAGDVDPDDACDRLERLLRRLGKGQPRRPSPPVLRPSFRRDRRRVLDREQSHLLLAFPAFGHGSAQVPAQRLLEGVLCGQSGRLFLELREERGLAYDVGATAVEGLGGGTLLVSAAVDPDRVLEARDSLWRVLRQLCENPVPGDELERVKARVVDGAVLGLQRASDRAGQLAAAERYGPGAEHWRALLGAPRAVGAAQLRDLACRVLRPDRCVFVEVGPDSGPGRTPTQ